MILSGFFSPENNYEGPGNILINKMYSHIQKEYQCVKYADMKLASLGLVSIIGTGT